MSLEWSPIRILEYQVLQVHFEILDFDCVADFNVGMDIEFEAGTPVEEDGLYRMQASILVDANPSDDQKSGSCFSMKARGMFEAASDSGMSEDFVLFMKYNAFSLLYGFVRNYAQQISSMSPARQVCLPCVDVSSIVEDLRSKEE